MLGTWVIWHVPGPVFSRCRARASKVLQLVRHWVEPQPALPGVISTTRPSGRTIFTLFATCTYIILLLEVNIPFSFSAHISLLLLTFLPSTFQIGASCISLLANLSIATPQICTRSRLLGMPGMGFFDHLQPKGSNALKVQKPQIRREVPKTDNKKHSSSNKPKNKLEPPRRDTSSSATGTPAPPSRVYAHGPRKLTKSRSTKRLQRKQQTVLVLESSSEDEDESSGQDHKRKRVKVQNTENSGPRRQLVALTAFADRQSAPLDYTHGVAITTQEAIKYIPAFPNSSETPELELQYPSRVARERYA